MKRQWDVLKVLLINSYFLSYGILLAYLMTELDTWDHSKDHAIQISILKKKLNFLFVSYNRNCILCHLFIFHKPTVHKIEKSIESHMWVNPLAFNVQEYSSIISLSLCSSFTGSECYVSIVIHRITCFSGWAPHNQYCYVKAVQCTSFLSFAALHVQSNVCPSQLNYLCDNPRIFHKA